MGVGSLVEGEIVGLEDVGKSVGSEIVGQRLGSVVVGSIEGEFSRERK